MAYFILMGRRIPKQAITGFKFQNETDNIRPFLSIRIRGKDEIIPFKDKKEIQSVKAHLCSVFSGFVKIGDWYLKMSEVKEYKPVMEVECNECTSKLFVDIIKSICKISEQVKSFINPEQIKAIAESNEPILLLSNN